jgi:O-antigen ligase
MNGPNKPLNPRNARVKIANLFSKHKTMISKRYILPLALLVLLAGCCFSHPFFFVRFGPLPLTADRLMAVLLVALYVIFRKFGLADPKPLRKTEILLGALLVVVAMSVVTHDWRTNDSEPVARFILYIAMPAVLYWIARQSKLSRRSVLWMFGGLAVFGVYLAVTAIAEVREAWWMVFPSYIASPEHFEFFGRARGPLLNPIGNGVFLSVCMCSAVMAWPRLNRPGKLVLTALCLLLLVGIWCTLTRSVWMGGLAALLVVIGLTTPRSWGAPLVGGAVLVSALLVATQWENFLAYKRDKYVSAYNVGTSDKLRPVLAAVAWQMFLDRPLFGCGYGQYLNESPPYLTHRGAETPLYQARGYVQHNAFLALLTETGLVGMGLFVSLLALWTRDAWRLWRSQHAPLWARQHGLLVLALVAAYVCNAMFHDLSIIPMVNMLLFFLAGVLAGLAPLAAEITASAPEPEPQLASARPAIPGFRRELGAP